MDEADSMTALLEGLLHAESNVACARRCAAAIGHRRYDSIALIQREIADLHDAIARDANKETGK